MALATHTAQQPVVPSAGSRGTGSGREIKLGGQRFQLRRVGDDDLWAVADMHRRVFYPTAPAFTAPLMRLDRIAALVLGKDLERGGLGRFQCIIAAAFPGAPRADRGSPGVGERGRDRLPSLSLQAFLLNLANNVAPMCSAGHPVVGAVVLDSLAAHVPPQRVFGSKSLRPRREVAYLSNLAVDPAYRGLGLAKRLVEEAERMAAKWGCRSVALHCDPTNKPAMRLYQALGYRKGAAQPEWDTYMLERRQLQLMIKRVPPRIRDPAELSRPEHQWLA